jgi:hypothetical protein
VATEIAQYSEVLYIFDFMLLNDTLVFRPAEQEVVLSV